MRYILLLFLASCHMSERDAQEWTRALRATGDAMSQVSAAATPVYRPPPTPKACYTNIIVGTAYTTCY